MGRVFHTWISNFETFFDLAVMEYNPDSNDDWWAKLCQGEEEETREDEQEPKKKRKKRKRKITSELAELEPFSTRHTAKYQYHELSRTLIPRLTQSLLQVEAETVQLKVKHFYGLKADQGEKWVESEPGLAEFVETVCPLWGHWEDELCDNGSPLLLVLTTSALRAVDLRRSVAPLCHKGAVAKLFARHMKVEEQALFLSSHLTPVAVATPNRAIKLIEHGCLKLDNLKCVLVDWYHRDLKQRQFHTVPEVWQDFCQMFTVHLNRPLQSKSLKLLLY